MWSYSYPAPPPPCGGAYPAYYPYAGPAYYDPYGWYWYSWYPRDPHWQGGHEPSPPWRHVLIELPANMTVPSRQASIGGTEEVRLTLEYNTVDIGIDTADARLRTPQVKVTIENADGTAIWNLSGFPAGFHTKRSFITVTPGSKLTLTVQSCAACLKWFEKFEDG